MEQVQEGKDHYPGEAPISADDLIFQIGELSVDLERKKKAIREVMTKLWHVSQEKIKLEEQISTDGGTFENLESEKQRIQEEAEVKIEEARQRITEENSDWENKIAQLRESHAEELQRKQDYLESEKEKMTNQIESEKEKMTNQIESEKEKMTNQIESEKEKMTNQIESEKEKVKVEYEKTIDQLKKKLEKQRKELSKLKDE